MKPGDKYGRLTVLKVLPDEGKAQVECKCGGRKKVWMKNLMSGHTQSCGCYHSEKVREANTVHGHDREGEVSTTYMAWASMLNNCTNPTAGRYDTYGALGVTLCSRWQGEGGFQRFLDDLGERPSEDHQLSRRDKKVGFTPTNTYWATKREVRRNTRQSTMYTVGKRTQCLVDWASEFKIPKATLHYRVVTKGMAMRDALDVGKGTSGKILPV